MKIAYDYSIFSSQSYGGISRYFYELALRLSKKNDCDVSIYSPVYRNEYIRNQVAVNVIGKYVYPFPKTGRLFNMLNQLVSPRLIHRDSPDIIHETYYLKNSYFSKIKAKSFITVYDMIHEKYSNHFKKKDHTTSNKKKAIERADHVICISENTKIDLLELFNVDPGKVSVIYLGSSFSNSDFIISNNIIAASYLLYVGDRAGYKNFEGLLKAYSSSFRLRNDFKLVCFGGGSFTSKERNLIKTLELSEENIFQCSGDDTVLANLYASASAFIYPSLYEGFGIPPLEAMTFKCPVVCSNTSSIPEVTGDAAEYFNPLSVENIMNAVENVVYSNDRIHQLINLGIERVKQFSWKKCADQTKALYSSLL